MNVYSGDDDVIQYISRSFLPLTHQTHQKFFNNMLYSLFPCLERLDKLCIWQIHQWLSDICTSISFFLPAYLVIEETLNSKTLKSALKAKQQVCMYENMQIGNNIHKRTKHFSFFWHIFVTTFDRNAIQTFHVNAAFLSILIIPLIILIEL